MLPMPIILITLYIISIKKKKNQLITLAFFLLVTSIGLLCNKFAEIGLINKNDDANLMIMITIVIYFISNRITKYIRKDEMDGDAL